MNGLIMIVIGRKKLRQRIYCCERMAEASAQNEELARGSVNRCGGAVFL